MGPGVACPKSRCWGVSRSRWSQSRSLFALPDPLDSSRTWFVASDDWCSPAPKSGSVLAGVKAHGPAGGLRPALTPAAGGAHRQRRGNTSMIALVGYDIAERIRLWASLIIAS
ncbi:MAG: hypothetical protein JWP07_2740 [Pseudonocardiales bacterium]|nr:hypothetical protein [Pseudonocardiales bacterium]